ncbi:MAG: hypothetical protein R2856_36695 [Caldilineaceae bacterium]
MDETNAQPATLRVDGLDELRPGDYEGEIVLSTTNPAGRPMDVKIRPSPTLPVTLSVPRSVARLQSQEADFGELPFETSPNFRIDRTTQVQFAYEQGRPFRLSAQLTDSSCPNLSVTTGEVEAQGDGYVLPLRLQSSGSVPPAPARGQSSSAAPTATSTSSRRCCPTGCVCATWNGASPVHSTSATWDWRANRPRNRCWCASTAVRPSPCACCPPISAAKPRPVLWRWIVPICRFRPSR